MKICLVSHTENFKGNEEKYRWIVEGFKEIEEELSLNIPITWALEEDDTGLHPLEIRARNRGDLITHGSDFFKRLHLEGHELGIHVHFVKEGKLDFSYLNQKRLIKNAKVKFIKAFGFAPKSFVGGWWHSDEFTTKILREEGFLVDASPLPLYSEKRRRWILGKIPTFSRIVASDWRHFKSRIPLLKEGILKVPNAIDPRVDFFSVSKTISLDLLDTQMMESLEVFRHFQEEGITFLCIPFHPHSLTREKFSKIKTFFIRCNKIDKLEFIRLQDLYERWRGAPNQDV